MPFFLDTRETSERFGKQILEFCSLFDANHVGHGSPDNIFEFAKALEDNNPFRMDLSAMVKSIVQKSEEILLTDMLSIIVTSVGGASFADTPADITRPNNTLMEFLLGTGCWRKFGSFSPPISKDESPPPRLPIRTEEPRHMRLTPAGSDMSPDMSIDGKDPGNRTGMLDSSSELRQMLTRIEVNTQHVKRHLDSIEQRINKIEPSPDSLSTRISSPSAIFPDSSSPDIVGREVAQPLADSIPVFGAELPTRSRAVFSQQPQQSKTNGVPSPAFTYVIEKGKNTIPIATFLALLIIVALSLFFALSGSGHDILKASMSHLKAVRSLFSSDSATLPFARTASVSSTSVPPSASTAKTPTLPSSVPPPHAKSSAETEPMHSMASNAAADISPDTQAIPVSPKIRYIPANVMEGYLLSAPRPEYPPLARIDHIEGSVVLQATISKMGSIETLHIIKGPQLLRNAATEAVRSWQYKPYSVDGRPAEVATTIYVDFTLKAPPEAMH